MPVKYAGAEWLRQRGKEVSPFGALVADILGQVYRGIYHIERDVMRTKWGDGIQVDMTTRVHNLGTFASSELTELVVLCHDHGVVLDVMPRSAHTLRLLFTKRVSGHPTLDKHMADIRIHVGLQDFHGSEPPPLAANG